MSEAEVKYDSKMEKTIKNLGTGVKDEMDAMKEADLRNVIVESTNSISVAIAELEANPQYQKHKEALKDVSASMKEVKKAQKAKIDYSLHLLGNMGKI
jgi:uncharacterized FlaG/YvyC family protein